ncbi:MAG: class I SAM-dependent methyltransferase [bacterium]
MAVFDLYGRYYNLLYEDKDYAAEVAYIDRLINKYALHAKTVLDLGCGTGSHDLLLVEKGYRVTGLDMSLAMLTEAQARLEKAARSCGASVFDSLAFYQADIRSVRLDRTFDVAISLFHVMSYQITNADLQQTFETVKAHLNPGGIFIFDCWYGPGVLTEPPAIRIKELEGENISVMRIAKPITYPHENVVDVNYRVCIFDKSTQRMEEFRECHRMRYLFKPEIDLFLDQAGFQSRGFFEFMKNEEPGRGAWNVCFVNQRL